MRPKSLFIAVFFAFSISARIASADPGDDGSANDAAAEFAAVKLDAAQLYATEPDAAELDAVVVIATRSARAVDDVPNTVDSIDRATMDDRVVRDLEDLFRYEPGISVGSSVGRFGIGDIRIRGLGGNRVAIRTDGIAVPDGFAIGSFANSGRNAVDLDTLKRVEVLRGPGSALYGSDALGGVVAFATKDPEDYLGREGRADDRRYVGLRLGYDSDWQGFSAGATTAAGGERWSWLVNVSHRQGREHKNFDGDGRDRDIDGPLRTAPNPQQRDGRSLLAKLVYAPDDGQRFRLTLEGNEDRTDTDVRNGRGVQPLTRATVVDLQGDDTQTRARLSFDHELDALDTAIADRLRWRVYRQDSATEQRTDEFRRTASGVAQRRARVFDFDQRLAGAEAVFEKDFAIGATAHALSYGVEFTRTRTRQKRDGLATTLATGAQTPVIPPDAFPVRDFPNSTGTTAALFVQDEIALFDARLRLIPAVRVDRYRLDPEADAIFAEDNPGIAVVGLEETSVSPKLGAVWRFADDWSLHAGYARGFRAPPYNDVNIGFTNLAFGYSAIPNPELKPETSDGIELGLRYRSEAFQASVAGYDNRYRDFIESLRFVGLREDGVQIFQSQNVARARIYGVEARGDLDFGAWSERWRGWSLRGAAAYSRGEDRDSGAPLDAIDPLRASLGLGYRNEIWGAELAGGFARGKTRVADANRYRPPGYGVLDLLAHWRFAPGARMNVGVFNLADRRYADWSDVPGVAAGSPTRDRYTRPGRTLRLALAFEW
jgi:hemoglobin/transferrin/lactoferrin receptor protein